MSARWGWVARLGTLMVLLLAGCTTPQPNLKPSKQAEVFNVPPANLNNNYPTQAFNTDDPSKRLGLDPGGLTPTRGQMMAPANFGGPTMR